MINMYRHELAKNACFNFSSDKHYSLKRTKQAKKRSTDIRKNTAYPYNNARNESLSLSLGFSPLCRQNSPVIIIVTEKCNKKEIDYGKKSIEKQRREIRFTGLCFTPLESNHFSFIKFINAFNLISICPIQR